MSEIFDRRRLQSYVRIWRGDVPIGSGFVVGKDEARYVMTCAHVVGDSAGAGKRAELKNRGEPPVDIRVRMDMLIASGRFFEGRVIPASWRPEGASEGGGSDVDDVALLEIVEGELPRNALPAGKTRSVREQDWIVGYGVAKGLPDGVAIGGRVQAILQNRFLIAAEAVDAAARPGCSGAPAWHSQGGGIAGMIAEMQQTQTGRVIPIDLLEQVCEFEWEDQLKKPLPPEPAPEALALDGLKEAAKVRGDIVVRYGADISRTSECANAVGDFKRLHDLVDRLRRNVHAPLRSVIQRLPAADAFQDLVQLRITFLDLRAKIVSIAAPPRFDEGVFPWIDEQLAFAADDLKQALEEQRHDLVAGANEYLRQIVERELTSLDARVAEATRRLDLDALIAKLGALRMELVESSLSADRIEALDRDIETLSQVEGRAHGLIALHHDWQRIDALINGVEIALSQSMDFVGTSWRLLSSKLAKVCPAEAPDAVPGLAESIETLDAAIKSRDSTRFGISFPELATRLRDRFFGIDQDLLEECEHIRSVGKSLSSVVEKLDGR